MIWEPDEEVDYLSPGKPTTWLEMASDARNLLADKRKWDQTVSPGEIRPGWWLRTPHNYHASLKKKDCKTLYFGNVPQAYLYRDGLRYVLRGDETENVIAEYQKYWDERLGLVK